MKFLKFHQLFDQSENFLLDNQKSLFLFLEMASKQSTKSSGRGAGTGRGGGNTPKPSRTKANQAKEAEKFPFAAQYLMDNKPEVKVSIFYLHFIVISLFYAIV